jgi:hypothetical protein
VNKLKACGLLDADLLHTLNGREYVTQKQLRRDIEDQLRRAGGRVAVRATALHALSALGRDSLPSLPALRW